MQVLQISNLQTEGRYLSLAKLGIEDGSRSKLLAFLASSGIFFISCSRILKISCGVCSCPYAEVYFAMQRGGINVGFKLHLFVSIKSS